MKRVALILLIAACSKREAPSAPPPASAAPAIASAPALPPSPSAVQSAAAPAAPPRGCDETMIALGDGCIDKTEVTVADYLACAGDKKCPPAAATVAGPEATDAAHALFDPLCNAASPDERAQHPMNCVDLAAAKAFCAAAGKRLPRGAEWEHAARGIAGSNYPWGATSPVSGLTNACGAECVTWKSAKKDLFATIKGASVRAEAFPGDDGFASTSPVGSFALGASNVGALDMAGNVEEWTVEDDGRAEVRGGSWLSTRDAELRADAHRALDPATRSATVGFRCAR